MLSTGEKLEKKGSDCRGRSKADEMRRGNVNVFQNIEQRINETLELSSEKGLLPCFGETANRPALRA